MAEEKDIKEVIMDALVHEVGFIKVEAVPEIKFTRLKLSDLLNNIEDLKQLKDSLVTKDRL